MFNIYSSNRFQEISEIASITPIHFSLFDSHEIECQIYGLQLGNESTYGIYTPFWLPNFAYLLNDPIKLENYLLELIRLTKKANPNGSITIRFPPYFYCKTIQYLNFLLEKIGFQTINFALWQMIDIRQFNSQKNYENHLKYSSRKVLKKLQEKNSRLELLNFNDINGISCAYNLINRNRLSIGVNLKYSTNYLLNLINIYGEKIKIFNFLVDETPVAAAITHIPQDGILYIAAWGDYGHTLSGSPMYQFASALVKYCLDNDLKFLDFGISSDLKLYTPNLFKFKQNIGCDTTTQRTYKSNF